MTEELRIKAQEAGVRKAMVAYVKGSEAKTKKEKRIASSAFLSGAGKVAYNTGQEILWKAICRVGQEEGFEQAGE